MNRSIYRLVLVWLLCLSFVLPALATPAGAATPLPGIFGGDAYGAWANAKAGQVSTEIGKAARIVCPCPGTGGKIHSASVNSLRAGKALTTGVVTNTTYTTRTSTSAYVRDTSSLTSVSLLGGRIRASSIKAVAITSANAKSISSNNSGSGFTGLTVLGKPVAKVSVNSRINLPGIGYAVLKETTRRGDGVSSGSIVRNMVHVYVNTSNSLGLPVGAQIIVGHASSSFARTVANTIFSGYAYAAEAHSRLSVLQDKIGRLAPTYFSCVGTNGKTWSHTAQNVTAGGLASIDAARTTTYSNRTSSLSEAQATARITSVSLLGGRVRADAVTSVAHTSYSYNPATGKGSATATTGGSSFTNLVIAGKRITVKPNLKVALPGIGYVVVYERSTSSGTWGASAKVTMLHVVVTQANSLGLPVGTDIRIASVADSTRKY